MSRELIIYSLLNKLVESAMRKQIFLFIIYILTMKVSLEAQSLKDSLILHLPLNENALDISGNGNHGIVHGASISTDI